MATKIMDTTLEKEGFIGRFYYAAKPSEKTMLVLIGSHGGIELAKDIAVELLPAGCNIMAIGYWKLPGLSDTLTGIELVYFEKIFHWLRDFLPAETKKLGIYGWSKGGELALLLASRYPILSLVVGAAPSFCLYNGLDGNHMPLDEATWVYNGIPLPYFSTHSYSDGETYHNLVEKDGVEMVTHRYMVALARPIPEETIIPVEQIQGAVLLLSSKNDEIWPANDACNRIMKRLDANKFPYPHEHFTGDCCSHCVVPLTPVNSRSALEKEHPKKCEQFRQSALQKTLAWMKAWS